MVVLTVARRTKRGICDFYLYVRGENKSSCLGGGGRKERLQVFRMDARTEDAFLFRWCCPVVFTFCGIDHICYFLGIYFSLLPPMIVRSSQLTMRHFVLIRHVHLFKEYIANTQMFNNS